jgi:hypothetical protein
MLTLKNDQVPAELMDSGRIFGSICFNNFQFDAENTVAVVSHFSRFGFGVHKLEITRGSISVSLLYLMITSVQATVDIIKLHFCVLTNASNLEVFSGTLRFDRLKKLVLRSDTFYQFYSSVFQDTPALESLTVMFNYDIILGKTALKKLSIGGFPYSVTGK